MSSRRTISNTFTVTTMDDPVSVQAQYSPDKTVVHTVWQEGDLYMRTRESDSSAWSSWHRIVGESGDETNYTFALSAYKVSQDGTSSTAPSDISANAWQDAPMATTSQKPYLWSKVQKKDGAGNSIGNPSYIRFTGEPGSPGGTGPRGKIGRFFYYAGEWNDFASTDSFLVNDAQAPYFYYNNNYWVFNPETNGTYTMSEMGAPSSSSTNWQIMTSDFKYIITEAIFGSYAHFGSFIINGDWMISQYGTINGSQSTSYTKFYPEFINGCSLCKSFDVDVNYIIAGSAYFIGGKTYYIKVSGSSFSSGCQLNVRMYNGSSNVGATLNLTSSSPSGTITFEPTTSGTYYLRADCQLGGMTAKLTAYVDDCFIPNFAINGLTGKSYQNDAYIKGQIVATSGSIDSISATNLNIKSGTITGDVTIGGLGVNIKLKPTGSGTGVGASIVAYDGAETPFSLLFDRYTYNGTYHPHANLTLKSTAPYNSKCGNVEITDTQSKRTLYYGSSQHPDTTYTLYEGYESITNFSGFVSKLSCNNAHHLRIGIASTGVAFIIADALPLASDKSSIPTGCIYRDGETLKIKV